MELTCRAVVCGALLWLATSVCASGQVETDAIANRGTGADRPPNVLILLADDMMHASMGMVDPYIQTPNLDRLAAEGVRFTHYAVNHPVCSPSRALLMTGLYAPVNGEWTNNLFLHSPHTTYLAEVFEHSGYATGIVGKWHLDGGADPALGMDQLVFRPRTNSYVWPSRRRGFQDWLAYECCQDHDVPFFWDEGVTPPAFTLAPEFGWEVKFQRAAMRDFVARNAAARKPWMYEVAFGLPHVPNEAPPEFLALYDPATIPLPPWLPEGLTETQLQIARETLQVVYAMISLMDHEIGEMMADLEELGEARNTIVVFTADNGDLLGSHWSIGSLARDGDAPSQVSPRVPPVVNFFRYKDTPFQNAFRVPLIMRWPAKIPANKEVNALFGSIDLPPTILSLADLPVPWRMQGDNMSEWALGGKGPVHPAIWVHLFRLVNPSFWSVWNGDYTYSAGDFNLLYDLKADPYETTNRLDDPALSDTQAELQSLLTSYNAEAQAAAEFPNLCGASEQVESNFGDVFVDRKQSNLLDGMPIKAYTSLMLAVACGDGVYSNTNVRNALLSAYGRNLEVFDRDDFVAAKKFRPLVTLAMCGSQALGDSMKGSLVSLHQTTLVAPYESVSCDDGGACFPVDPFAPAERGNRLRGTTEPFSASGDLDGDGVTNLEEYLNARAARTGIDGFVQSALDPARDGSETGSSGGGGGGGGCFIATAAYGSPLASQLNELRAVRDDALLTNAAGAAFADVYYRIGSRAADWIAPRESLKAGVRVLLNLLLLALKNPAAATLLIVAIPIWRISRRRTRTHR